MDVTDVINVHPKCILCQGLECESSEELFQHLSNAHKEECVKCRFCNRLFFRSSDFDSHTIKHKGRWVNLYRCALCPISFFSKTKLKEHQSTHDNFNNYVDGFIPAVTPTTVAKVRRKNSHKTKHDIANQDKLMKCLEGVVDDNFVDMSKFIETSDTEENETKSKHKKSKRKSIPLDALCSIDTETDESKIDDLNNDSNKEENVTNSCDGNLQKAETNVSSLAKENESDSNLELTDVKSIATLSMLACNLCTQMFSNETFLVRHLEIHKKRDFKCKYVCKYCNVRYSLPVKLFAHFARMHKTETPFSCDICGKAFSSKPDFSGHIKSEHSQEGIIKFLPNGSIIYARKKDITASVNEQGNTDLDNSGVTDRELSKNEQITSKSNELLVNNLQEKDPGINCTAEDSELNFEKSNVLNNTTNDTKKPKVKTSEMKIRSSRRLAIKSKRKKNNFNHDNDRERDKEKTSEPSDLPKNDINNEKPKSLFEHCDICDMRILAVSMKKHLKRHAGQNGFKCHLCGRKMKNPSKFHYHMKMHFDKDKYLCVCGVKLPTQALFEEHKRKLHTNDSSAAKHNFTVIRTVHGSIKSNVDPFDSKGVASQILMKKSNEKSCIFNVRASGGNFEVNNFIKSPLRKFRKVKNDANVRRSQIINEEAEFQPRNISILNDNIKNCKKTNIIIKKITPEEAEAKRKLVIKPVPVNEVRNSKSSFKIQAVSPKPTFPSASVVIRPKVDIQSFKNINKSEFNVPSRSKTKSKQKRVTTKHQATQTKIKIKKKYLKINMDHVTNSEVTEVKLVNSNPLAHLLKEPIRTDGLPSKGKQYDYQSIIQKSLTSQFDSLVS